MWREEKYIYEQRGKYNKQKRKYCAEAEILLILKKILRIEAEYCAQLRKRGARKRKCCRRRGYMLNESGIIVKGSGDNGNRTRNTVYRGGHITNRGGNIVNGGGNNTNEGETTINGDQNTINREKDIVNGGEIL